MLVILDQLFKVIAQLGNGRQLVVLHLIRQPGLILGRHLLGCLLDPAKVVQVDHPVSRQVIEQGVCLRVDQVAKFLQVIGQTVLLEGGQHWLEAIIHLLTNIVIRVRQVCQQLVVLIRDYLFDPVKLSRGQDKVGGG